MDSGLGARRSGGGLDHPATAVEAAPDGERIAVRGERELEAGGSVQRPAGEVEIFAGSLQSWPRRLVEDSMDVFFSDELSVTHTAIDSPWGVTATGAVDHSVAGDRRGPAEVGTKRQSGLAGLPAAALLETLE